VLLAQPEQKLGRTARLTAEELASCPQVLPQQGLMAGIQTKDILVCLLDAVLVHAFQELAAIGHGFRRFAPGCIERSEAI